MDKKIIIFDIDGTVADCSHRLHYVKVKPKNWLAFVKGIPLDTVIAQTQFIYHALVDRDDTFTIVLTGRGEDVREATEAWLAENNFRYDVLLMRPAGDYRPDYVVKEELIARVRREYGEPFFAMEDKREVVDVYRRNGIFTFDVNHRPEISEPDKMFPEPQE